MLSVALLTPTHLDGNAAGPAESDDVGVVVSITPAAEPTQTPTAAPTTPTPTDEPSPAPTPGATKPAPDRLATTGSPPVALLLICSAGLVALGWFFVAIRRRHHAARQRLL